MDASPDLIVVSCLPLRSQHSTLWYSFLYSCSYPL